MTVIQNPGRLQLVFSLPDEKTRTEAISNIRPTAQDQDLYDVANAIADLISDPLSLIRVSTSKDLAE